jgi:uncharacterized repeat protein (TIGR04138 family)
MRALNKRPTEVEWEAIRQKAKRFPDEAYKFVREGLHQTVTRVHPGASEQRQMDPGDESRHVTGRDLCVTLRDMARDRYGLLAKTVLGHWGVYRTDDFGVLVYAMIDRKELRSSDRDSLEDFREIYDFDEAFGQLVLN